MLLPKLLFARILRKPPGQRPALPVSTLSVYSALPHSSKAVSRPPVATPSGARKVGVEDHAMPAERVAKPEPASGQARPRPEVSTPRRGTSTGWARAGVDAVRTSSPTTVARVSSSRIASTFPRCRAVGSCHVDLLPWKLLRGEHVEFDPGPIHGSPARMRREKSGALSAAWAAALMRLRRVSSSKGRVGRGAPARRRTPARSRSRAPSRNTECAGVHRPVREDHRRAVGGQGVVEARARPQLVDVPNVVEKDATAVLDGPGHPKEMDVLGRGLPVVRPKPDESRSSPTT